MVGMMVGRVVNIRNQGDGSAAFKVLQAPVHLRAPQNHGSAVGLIIADGQYIINRIHAFLRTFHHIMKKKGTEKENSLGCFRCLLLYFIPARMNARRSFASIAAESSPT